MHILYNTVDNPSLKVKQHEDSTGTRWFVTVHLDKDGILSPMSIFVFNDPIKADLMARALGE